MLRLTKVIIWPIGWMGTVVFAFWSLGAVYYDFPITQLRVPAAIIFVVLVFSCLFFLRPGGRKMVGILCLCAGITGWWFTLKPTNIANWQPDVSETAWAEISGDEVTVHNVRNCEYRTENDYIPHWETRVVRLSQLNGMDVAITYWGSPWIAHPIVSFDFSDSSPLCFSIETRKKVGQEYSELRAFYRQYTLIYVVADERDSIRVRSNYRKGEDVYLYRLIVSPQRARTRFLEYVNALNGLHAKPRWYNALSTNCTTSIRTQSAAGDRIPWDWRILLNGKADEMLYERHEIKTGGLPFAELKRRSWINPVAQAANNDPDFSGRIRAGLPDR
jgi:hypothetical protein